MLGFRALVLSDGPNERGENERERERETERETERERDRSCLFVHVAINVVIDPSVPRTSGSHHNPDRNAALTSAAAACKGGGRWLTFILKKKKSSASESSLRCHRAESGSRGIQRVETRRCDRWAYSY